MRVVIGSVDMHGRGGREFKPALRIAVTVIGHSSLGFAITDGGSKSFALDGPPPRVFLYGELVGWIEWCGDEFGRVLPLEELSALPIGTVVECTVPHCDPTISTTSCMSCAAPISWRNGRSRRAAVLTKQRVKLAAKRETRHARIFEDRNLSSSADSFIPTPIY